MSGPARPGRRRAILLLKLALIAPVFAFVGWKLWQDGRSVDFRKLLDHWGWLLLAQVCIFNMLFITAYRFRLLLEAQGIHYPLREIVALNFIGFFFNQFTPGSTGGDVVKAFYIAVDHRERRTAGITTVFLDRGVGVLALAMMAGVSIVLNWQKIAGDARLVVLAWITVGIVGGSALGATLFFSRRFRSLALVQRLKGRLPFREQVMKIQSAIYIYRNHPRRIAAVIALSVVSHTSIVGMAFSFSRALEIEVTLANLFFIVPLGHLFMAIPIVPGGVGQLEVAFNFLFEWVAGVKGPGIIIALMQRLNWYLWALVGAAPYLRRRANVRRAREMGGAAA